MANIPVSTLPALGTLISFIITIGWWGRFLFLRWTVRSGWNFKYVAPFWFFTVIFSAFTFAMTAYWFGGMMLGDSSGEGAQQLLEFVAVVAYCFVLGDYIAVRMRSGPSERAASEGSKPSS